ncbi:hypothetical protein [Thalassotalea castellviae]|uniref:Cytochrome oxidase assembly protein n=1 Tax=Thalassotalea castellviae TaxID=3075612 RepID=A0ABU3A1R7_9GAMM|nr:hypothetical protein [Thalassotalea sp. W431]MDT0604117.1 hypothetical protein [Thalassotalea sp. W431]
MSSPQVNKSRRTLLITLAVFILPVVLAKLALEQHWFNYGVTNHGQLAEQELTLTDLGVDPTALKEQWLILYRLPANCQQLCEKTLLSLNNTYTLLGKELPRVTPIVLYEKSLAERQLSHLRHAKWQQLSLPEQANEHIESNQVVIVDPLGNVVMSYQGPKEKAGLVSFDKAILADMKKLLKYSRIG